jgi:hypothetical protein
LDKEDTTLAEMTRRERILASARKQRSDRLPFYHNWRHIQDGWAEREARNLGMGLIWDRQPYKERLHGVEVTEQHIVVDGVPTVRRTFTTPVGSVYEDERREPGTYLWKLNRSYLDQTPWLSSRRIKEPEDYKVVKYIVENTEFVPDYFALEQAADWLGDDGIVMDSLPHSPMQMLLIDWVGSEGGRVFYHLADHPDLVEDLYQTISRCREAMYQIAAESPAPVALCGDNVDGFLVNRTSFEKYFMPEYEKQAKILHAHDKIMAVHMDGRLNGLKHLIAKTPIDIIEAFHPLPMGDLPLDEALALWPNHTIWLGFPGAVYALGPEATRERALELLAEAGTGDRLAIAASTENLVSNQNLITLAKVMEQATLPLSPRLVERITAAVPAP